MADILTLSAVAFFVVVAIIVYVDRKNVEFKPFMVMRRTKRGIKIIDSVAKSAPRFWNFIGLLSIPTAAMFMVAGVVMMLYISGTIISGEQKGPAMSLILPSLSSQQQTGLGGFVFFLPLWFWLVMVTVLLVPHEVFHGILSRTVKVPLKSVGLMMLLIFPGAFVEPDENKLKRARRIDRLKVFASGAFANILTAVLLFALLTQVFQPAVVAEVGVKIYGVDGNSPAAASGLAPNMTITGMNGLKLDKNSRNPVGDIMAANNLKPGDSITVSADEDVFRLTLSQHPQNASRPFMGITTTGPVITKTNYLGVDSALAVFSYTSLIIYFALVIALVNLLPWKPFDGGLFFETLMEYVSKKHALKIANAATMFILAVFLFNFFGPVVIKLLA
ncbi:MAG: site-2 protease family protein [Candidatus Aenigmarchaeota archaeon]|nr:site-2 protease family protein [Candidatus Aenigmarchaeota archaeon]